MIFTARNLKQFVPDAQGRYLLTQQDLADLQSFVIEAAPIEPDLVPGWFLFSIDTSQTSAVAATSGSFTLLAMPPGTVVHACKLKHSAQFGGGSISALTASLGITGTTGKFASGHNCLAAVADGAQTVAVPNSFESHSSSVNLLATLAATGGNLSVLTAGRLEIYVLLSRTTIP